MWKEELPLAANSDQIVFFSCQNSLVMRVKAQQINPGHSLSDSKMSLKREKGKAGTPSKKKTSEKGVERGQEIFPDQTNL